MNALIRELENKMWHATMNGDRSAFSEIVSADAVMVCGGYRCTGAEYAELITDFGITEYEISGFELVNQTDKTVQVHYIVRTTADLPENADLAGRFHVTSTWEYSGGRWQLIFNMDSRIIECDKEILL